MVTGIRGKMGLEVFSNSLLFLELDWADFYTETFLVQFSTKHVLTVLFQNSKVQNAMRHCEKYSHREKHKCVFSNRIIFFRMISQASEYRLSIFSVVSNTLYLVV